jgi:serine/threonine protein kinase
MIDSIDNFYTLHKDKDTDSSYAYAVRKSDGVEMGLRVYVKQSFNEQSIDNLINEIIILKHLNHPNTVQIRDVFEDPVKIFITHEKYERLPILQALSETNFYNELQLRDICEKLLEIIQYCHKRLVIHGDLKLSNIMIKSLTEPETLLLTNFGYYRHILGPDNLLNGCCGTPIYIAPEMLDHKSVYREGIDVWAYGVIVHIFLSGYPPFFHPDCVHLEELIKNGKLKFEANCWNNVSPEAMDFVKELLNTDPNRRLTVDQALLHPWVRLIFYLHFKTYIPILKLLFSNNYDNDTIILFFSCLDCRR